MAVPTTQALRTGATEAAAEASRWSAGASWSGVAASVAAIGRAEKVSAFEETLGTNWLTKLGIVMLVIGVALLGIFELRAMGPAGKVVLSYLTSVVLLAGGIAVEKRANYQLLGRAGIGGGWALLFFSTFGMYHVAAMRVLDSLTLDCVLMLAVAVGMAAHTLRYRSQFVTGLAFLLGYTTVALSENTVYSLLAGAMLAIGLIGIVLRMGWFELEVFGILSTYLNHLYWLYRLLGIDGANGRRFEEYTASTLILALYWVTFRISYLARQIQNEREEHLSTAAALLNAGLLLGALKFQSVRPELAYVALLAVGVFEFVCAQIAGRRNRREAFIVLSVLGSALVLAAVPSHYSGNNVAILWLVGAEVFLIAGAMVKEVVFRRIGLLTGLLVGAHLVAVDFRALVHARLAGEARVPESAVLFGLCAIVLYMNAMGIERKWREFFTDGLDGGLLTTHSYVAAFSAAACVWAGFTGDWTALAFAAVMLTIAALARNFESPHLHAHYAVLGAVTLYRAVAINAHFETPRGTHLAMRLATLPLVAGAFYAATKLAALGEEQGLEIFRGFFAAAGTGLLGLLIWTEAPEAWQPVALVALAIALAEAGRGLRYTPLVWHANVLGAFGALRAFFLDYHAEPRVWPGISLHLAVICLTAGGLYVLARRAAPREELQRATAFLHSFAATGLLALLAYYEAPNGWLAPLWAGFALVLTVIDRRWEADDLRWQAHLLSLLALVRCLTANLHIAAVWHGLSVRLLSLAIVAAVFYAMVRLVRLPEEWRAKEMHYAYSWAASAVVALMLWYELKPMSIAVGWAAFGLVLFEFGLLRKGAQFRYQGYVALVASFVRIFFANLTVNVPGTFWNERTLTVLPLALIFFFVYAQLPEIEAAQRDSGVGAEPKFPTDALMATLGTASVAALFYFQIRSEWVVTVWGAMSFALLGTALLMSRPVFQYQALAMTLLTFVRGMAHNLFGASYFAGTDWTGRYAVLGAAVALLLAGLVFAFPLRERGAILQGEGQARRAIRAIAGRPEQVQFFTAIVLLTFMLALKMRAGMVTVSWGIEGVLVILLALAVSERSFRLTGLGLLLLCVGKVLVRDAWDLQPRDRYVTFIIVGLALLLVSYLYSRYREAIRQFL